MCGVPTHVREYSYHQLQPLLLVADHLKRKLGRDPFPCLSACIVGRSRRMTGFVQNLPKVSPNGESRRSQIRTNIRCRASRDYCYQTAFEERLARRYPRYVECSQASCPHPRVLQVVCLRFTTQSEKQLTHKPSARVCKPTSLLNISVCVVFFFASTHITTSRHLPTQVPPLSWSPSDVDLHPLGSCESVKTSIKTWP